VRNLMQKVAFLIVLLAAAASVGCGRPFDIKTPSEMLELKDQDPPFAYRAMTPDGVVVAMRVVDDDRADLGFWEHAVTLRIRELAGYSLLHESDVTSHDGTKGKELVFGHDENGKPYVYKVRVFVAQGRVFVLEAGGAKPQMDRYTPVVDWTMNSVKVTCRALLSPVFASRTCNRW